MIDIGAESLLLVLDEKTTRKVWRALKGCRITFPRCKIEYNDIKVMHKEMMAEDISNTDAVHRLAEIFEVSEKHIRHIISKEGDLFDY